MLQLIVSHLSHLCVIHVIQAVAAQCLEKLLIVEKVHVLTYI